VVAESRGSIKAGPYVWQRVVPKKWFSAAGSVQGVSRRRCWALELVVLVEQLVSCLACHGDDVRDYGEVVVIESDD
jgi:hypothetical protein